MGSALEAEPFLEPYAKPFVEPYGSARGVSQPAGGNSIFLSTNPEGGSILGDPRLSGMNVNKVPEPANTVMFYDEKPWSHGEGLACYVDGHAKTQRSYDTITEALKIDPRSSGGSGTLGR
jgi:hypothetical protein